jgi:hypothetical protein
MNWTQTAIVGKEGVNIIVPDDWVLEREGSALARIHKICVGPQENRWFWEVMICSDGNAGAGGTGYAGSVREARKQCEARILEQAKPVLEKTP